MHELKVMFLLLKILPRSNMACITIQESVKVVKIAQKSCDTNVTIFQAFMIVINDPLYKDFKEEDYKKIL